MPSRRFGVAPRRPPTARAEKSPKIDPVTQTTGTRRMRIGHAQRDARTPMPAQRTCRRRCRDRAGIEPAMDVRASARAAPALFLASARPRPRSHRRPRRRAPSRAVGSGRRRSPLRPARGHAKSTRSHTRRASIPRAPSKARQSPTTIHQLSGVSELFSEQHTRSHRRHSHTGITQPDAERDLQAGCVICTQMHILRAWRGGALATECSRAWVPCTAL